MPSNPSRIPLLFALTLLACVLLPSSAPTLAAPKAAAPQPTALQDGIPLDDTVPGAPNTRPGINQYTFTTPENRIFELTLKLNPVKEKFPPVLLQIVRGRQVLFVYRFDCALEKYLAFPVLEKGTYQILLRHAVASAPFTLQLRSIKPEVTEQEKTAALAAIEKATANLLATTPAKSRESPKFAVAVESLVMNALASDHANPHLETIEKDYLPWLKAQLVEVPTVQWNGQSVSGFTRSGSPMYCHAIATLALAELAPHSPAAKELAEKCAPFLLASQLTDRRPAAWRTAKKTDPHFGGWRYLPNSPDSDLSVSGWCIIALNACAVSDIQPDGMRDSLKDAVTYVKRTSTRDGFGYGVGGGAAWSPAPIRNAIGSLVFALYGENSRAADSAQASLDRHLFAGTQADDAMDYPLYYAYYATRLHYLRGSLAWETWRMTAIRQLIKLQRLDGSWPTLHAETEIGPQRYSTALAILILRMCLNDQPAYMTQEIKGF